MVKCRPPNNRDPKEEEVKACSIHTQAIIELVKPKVIVTLGNHSGRYVFSVLGGREWRGVSRMRGRSYELELRDLGRVLVIPTYHPAAALYNPRVRPALEKDFSLIAEARKNLTRVEGSTARGRSKSLMDSLRK